MERFRSGACVGAKEEAERRETKWQTEGARNAVALRMSLVTSALGAQWNGRGREGDRADRQPVKRSGKCVGHDGGKAELLRNFVSKADCDVAPSL